MSLFKRSDSKEIALERLNKVILKDRTDFSADIMEKLSKDLIKTISNYMEPDKEKAEIHIDTPSGGDVPILTVKIPITNIFKETQVD